MKSPELPYRDGNALLAVGLGLLALVLGVSSLTTRPPRALRVDAPPQLFSAGRALAVLSGLLGEGQPHPIGSEPNRELQRRIWRKLEEMGYQPQLQREAVCGESGTVCGVVENVLARLEGSRDGKVVMLSCHYDSVAAGPGAGDDGSGVAALLEIARIFKQGPPPANPILFFFGDGEEVGLLGAEAFVQRDPWAVDVGAVINVEARGTSGRSWMFETSRAPLWLVRAYARGVSQPATSSIAYAIYKRLPNDTDLTVYKASGLQGLGLAFIGDVQRYHTPLDNLAHLSPNTLQQQGQTALQMARTLSAADLSNPERGEVVFFDLAGLATVWWPQAWSTYFSLVAVILLVMSLARLGIHGRIGGREFVWGFFLWPAMIGVTALVAVALGWLLDWMNVFPSPFPARSWPSAAAFWCVGFSCPLLVAATVGRRAGVWGLWSGSLFWWTSVALSTTLLEPAFGYPFLPPLLIAALAVVWLVDGKPGPVRDGIGLLSPVLVSSLIMFPTMGAFQDAFGRGLLPLIAVLVALTISWLAPVAVAAGHKTRWRVALVGLSAVAVFSAAAVVGPAYTPELPQHLNIWHVTNGAGQSQWRFLGQKPLPRAIAEATGQEPRLAQMFPWSGATVPTLEAPGSTTQGPLFEMSGESMDGADRIMEATIRSGRGAPFLELIVPAEVRLETVKYPSFSEIAVESREPRGPSRRIRFFVVPDEGIRVRLRSPSTESGRVFLWDAISGLPTGAEELRKARGEAVAYGQGDLTVSYREVGLLSPVGASE